MADITENERGLKRGWWKKVVKGVRKRGWASNQNKERCDEDKENDKDGKMHYKGARCMHYNTLLLKAPRAHEPA